MNPRSQDVLKVIRNFESVLPIAVLPGHLDMGTCPVVYKDQNHVCGTIHCVGGWYMVSRVIDKDTDEYIGFVRGVKEMEADLGFKPHNELIASQLILWAKDNPAIWGNENGFVMFASESAYISVSRPSGANKLHDVVDHWKEVYQRLVELENATTEVQPPVKVITKYVSVPESLVQETTKLILS